MNSPNEAERETPGSSQRSKDREKRAETVVYGQTEENLQLPECTALATFQGHTLRFPAGTVARELETKIRFLLDRERCRLLSRWFLSTMVLSCIVPGCTEKKRKGHAGISFHHLPVKDRERCKEWLRAANNPKYGEDVELDKLRIQRICSLHFRPEDFELNVLGMKRTALKETAVPSVLLDLVTQRQERPGPSGRTPVDTRSRAEESGNKSAPCQRLSSRDEQTTANPKEILESSEDEDEDLGISLSVGDGRHLVDLGSPTEFVVEEKCLIELFKTCRGCGKKCAVRKQVKGLKLEISQYCVHCQRCWNWTNLPDDDDHRADIHVNSKQDAAQKQIHVASANS